MLVGCIAALSGYKPRSEKFKASPVFNYDLDWAKWVVLRATRRGITKCSPAEGTDILNWILRFRVSYATVDHVRALL